MRQWLRSHLTYASAPATLASVAAILVLASAGLVALSSPSTARSRGPRTHRRAQAANQPHCGDTITTNIVLHKDLVNCPNNGLIIGADNITLNLNGHTIDGDGTPTAGCPDTEFCDTGVGNFRHDGVTVVNGSVRQFVVGVFVAAADHNRLLGLSSTRNRFTGFFVAKARHDRLLGVSAAKNKIFGIFFFRSDRCLVRNSAANRTKGHGGDQVGMFMRGSHHDRILHSSFRHNVPAGNGTGGGIASVQSTDSVISGNVMSRNGEAGIIMEGIDRFRITHNRLVRNHDGIAGGGRHNVITRNHVFGGGDGIRIDSGHGNLIAHNVVAHTSRAGISLGSGFRIKPGGRHLTAGGAHNLVRRNLVKGNRKYGFLVRRKDDHSRLKRNVAKRSGDDGFHVESHSAKLTGNRAVRNGDLGIEAVRGVADGGGNVARHNGDPRQCINIVCR
jgi:parallel beta-helix repeat protein